MVNISHSKVCLLCGRSNKPVHCFNGNDICESCIDIMYHLIQSCMIKPTTGVEETLFSLLFYLEKEIAFNREILNGTVDLSSVQSILNTKIQMLDELPIDFTGVNAGLTAKYQDLINQYRIMLTMFIS